MAPENDSEQSDPLIPGLPDEIAEICLLHLPYPYQASVRSVSASWNRTITNPNFQISRNFLSISQPYLFIFSFHRLTNRIQWQALDPRSHRWFVLPPMPCPKSVSPLGFSCSSIPRQGKLFVLGGLNSDTETPMQNAVVYSTSTNQWSIISPMLSPRSFFESGNINGQIMAVGGSGGVGAVECYNAKSNRWTKLATMRTGLTKYDSAVVGNKMYVTEGWTWPFMFSPRGGVYDSGEDKWGEMRDGMKEGWTGKSVVIGERLFVISEHGDCPMKVYDPDEDSWEYVVGEKLPREVMVRPYAVSGVEGRIYVVSRGLHVGVGRVYERSKREWCVEWQVLVVPKGFEEFSPCDCHLLYA